MSFEWNKSKQKVLALKSKIDKMENEIDKMENELNKNILDIMALNLQNAYLIEENKKLSKMDEDNFQQIKNLLIQVDYLVGVVRRSPKDPEERILIHNKRRLKKMSTKDWKAYYAKKLHVCKVKGHDLKFIFLNYDINTACCLGLRIEIFIISEIITKA